MKKLITLLFTAFLFCITACGYNERGKITNDEFRSNNKRMTTIYNDGFCVIWVDNQTGVQYLRNGQCICVMVDKEGNPLIYGNE